MHYAKPNPRSPIIEDATPESCDKPPRVKASDLGFHVPEHFLPDIIPLSDPKLLFSNYHAQRDRRLRQLIRRYTNQIQYGCRNLNCNTLTCLSYRRRNSTAPLRRHTDLSARTLACQLVEEYTRAGKDPVVGLCQNEPVVPWYDDPAASKKRRNSLEKSSQLHHGRSHENGNPIRGSTASQPLKDPLRHAPLAEHPVKKSSHDGVILAGRMLRSLENKNQQPSVQTTEDVVNILNSTLSRDRRPSKSN